MQVYAELRILTARPTAAEEAALPHRLYGFVPAAQRFSVGRWLEAAGGVLAAVRETGRLPVIVGGTGLYFRALTAGLAGVPEIPDEIRRGWASMAAGTTTAELHRLLAARHAAEAARVRATDRARILRALEVIDATGRPLPEWHAATRPAPLVDPDRARRLILEPPRDELYRRIDHRFEAMIEAGAVEEAARIATLGLDPALPAMKAIGLGPLLAHLHGRIGLHDAIAAGQTETRRYAKRQLTWFRNQMPDWERV
jgi:tRNA dimethylallyltransferase